MNLDSIHTTDRAEAPSVHEIGILTLPGDDIIKLDNGVTLHTLSGGTTDVCRIKILLPGGIAESSVPKIIKMANSLMLEGTQTHTAETLSDMLDYNGAWTGLETSTHHSALSIYCMTDVCNTLLPLAKEIITTPSYAASNVDNALHAEAAKLEVDMHNVSYRAECAIRKLVYGAGHPLAAEPTPEDIKSITPDMISRAHMQRLDMTGTHIYISGRLSKTIIDNTAETFSAIESTGTFKLHDLQFPLYDTGAITHVEMPDSMQSCVKIMLPVIGRNHPDYIPLRMAAIALGGYFGSRLMLNIREDKGLTYGISASLLGYRNNGFLSITSQTGHSTVAQVISETINELERMKKPDSYSNDEITRMSRFVLSELAEVLDTPFSRMDFLQTQVTAGTPEGYYAMQERCARQLSAELLADIAEKYFDTSRLFIATAGK